jgi:hypothetical protein
MIAFASNMMIAAHVAARDGCVRGENKQLSKNKRRRSAVCLFGEG